MNLSLISKSKQNKEQSSVISAEQTSAVKGAVISLSHLKKQAADKPIVPSLNDTFQVYSYYDSSIFPL